MEVLLKGDTFHQTFIWRGHSWGSGREGVGAQECGLCFVLAIWPQTPPPAPWVLRDKEGQISLSLKEPLAKEKRMCEQWCVGEWRRVSSHFSCKIWLLCWSRQPYSLLSKQPDCL